MITEISKTILPALGLTLALALPAQAANDSKELSLEQLLNTTVTSASKYEQKQSEVAAVVSVITRDEIKAFGWRTLDQALASLPGIHLTYDRQYSYLGARGFGLPGDYNTRMLLAINGNRINETVYAGASIGRDFPLDLDLVERIEFIAGPGGAVYGQNAMFGVVNVITRSGATVDGGELSAGWTSPQSLREGRISWGKVLGNGVNVLASASGMYSRGEDLLMDYPSAGPGESDISGLAVNQDGERDKEFFTRIIRGPLSLDFIYGNRRKDDPTASFFSDALAPDHYERDKSMLSQLAYQDSFARKTLDVLGRMFLGQYRYTGLFHYATAPNLATAAGDWLGAELRLLYKGLNNHKLMLGMEGQNNSRIDQTNDDLTTPGMETQINGSGTRFGIYTQDEWRLSDTWSTTLGVRVDRNNNTDTLFSPRAALIWQALPETTLKAMYGRAHRAPNAYERDYDDGVAQVANPTLENETIDTLELNIEQRLTRDFSVRTSIYQWSMLDIVTLGIDPLSGLPQYQSGDKLTARGVELSADKTWESGGRVRGSVAYQDIAYANNEEPLNSPQWLGKLNLSQPLPWPGLRLGYELRYDAKRQTIDGSYLKGYWLSNLTVTASKWLPRMEISLGIHNLFDQYYEHPTSDINWQNALAQDGRSVWAKMDYRF
ncbi:TonB-dependent receptor plug domain-containing protein [Thiovibrio frasassiensis]|uniref:TonB-dependent receptor n=1 Tax=Thiovibrio frasassiensis TaxID=2984131 RepID=A0A9X4RLY0_9BACT|nr:TonB-dependent receptor [Thiovibrio frasassiensis]MDG4475628.1 TonB-dependent receptor [Thiovibrio frasassiensis]